NGCDELSSINKNSDLWSKQISEDWRWRGLAVDGSRVRVHRSIYDVPGDFGHFERKLTRLFGVNRFPSLHPGAGRAGGASAANVRSESADGPASSGAEMTYVTCI